MHQQPLRLPRHPRQPLKLLLLHAETRFGIELSGRCIGHEHMQIEILLSPLAHQLLTGK